MTGASPNTAWLKGCVSLDDKGFIRTGIDLAPQNLEAADWPLSRSPLLFETTLPGVFAVGDVRSNNVKRVASAVGEGSMAVQFVGAFIDARPCPHSTISKPSSSSSLVTISFEFHRSKTISRMS